MTTNIPNKYQKGKIYKIIPKDDAKNIQPEDCYIGSTTENYITARLAGHRRNYKHYKAGKFRFVSSYKLFDKFGLNGVQIILIENSPCNTRAELESREKFYIQSMVCCNKNVAGRKLKEYYKDNKDKFKEYYQENKDKIKEYRGKNKDKMSKYLNKYREQNKDKINKKFQCECGGKYTKENQARHFKTKKHQKYIESN